MFGQDVVKVIEDTARDEKDWDIPTTKQWLIERGLWRKSKGRPPTGPSIGGARVNGSRPRGRPRKSTSSTEVIASTLRLSQTVADIEPLSIGGATRPRPRGRPKKISRSTQHRGESPSTFILAIDSEQSTLQTTDQSVNMDLELIDPPLSPPSTRKRGRDQQDTPGVSRKRSALTTINLNGATNHSIDRGDKRTIKLTAHSTLRESMFN
jgi:hypothetical protein